jgi:hypothetical protein
VAAFDLPRHFLADFRDFVSLKPHHVEEVAEGVQAVCPGKLSEFLRHCSNVKGNGLGRSRLDRTAIVICTNHIALIYHCAIKYNYTTIRRVNCLIFLLSRDLFALNGFGTVLG